MPSETLVELVNTLHMLERRVIGSQSAAARLISQEDLVQALLQTGTRYLSSLQTSDRANAPPLDLSRAVRRTIDAKLKKGRPDLLLSIRHIAILQATEYLFRYLENSADLDPLAYAAIQHLQLGLARVLVEDPGALSDRDYPARRFLELVVDTCRSYDSHSGPGADALMARVGQIMRTVIVSSEPAQEAYDSALSQFITLRDDFEKQTLAIAKNIILKENGELMSSDAKLAVKEEMLKIVEGRKLPVVMLEFLVNIWGKYLYITYLRHGMDSRAWNNGVKDIRTLVNSLFIRDREELFHLHSSQLARVLARVRNGSDSIHGDWALARKFFHTMDAIYERRMAGEEPELEESVAMRAERAEAVSALIAPAVPESSKLHLLASLRVGHWYKLPVKGLLLRSKLIEKNERRQYCLFSNLSGIKLARLDFADIAGYLRSGTLKPIDRSAVIDQAMAFSCGQIALQVPKLESQAQSAERKRTELLEQRRRQQTEQRLRKQEEQRLRDETRRLEEARRREHEAARQEAEARAEAERAAREHALQQVLVDVHKMQPGGSAEFIDPTGQKMTCKLGLKLKSSGKLIFVDRLGRKTQELLPGHFAERILEGAASIVDFGVAYDYGLQSLIIQRGERHDA